MTADREERVLVLMPTAKDAERTCALLQAAGLANTICHDLVQLSREIAVGAGAALLTEEVIVGDRDRCLETALQQQPAWSDFPLIVLSHSGTEIRQASFRESMNVSLVERPVRMRSLLSVVRAALRSRRHQYAVRDHLADRIRAGQVLARDALLLANVHDAVVVTDLKGVITYWNQGATRLFGWTADEMIGRPYVERFPEPARSWIADQIRQRAAGSEWSGEFEDYRKDGSRVWIEAHVARVYDPAGNIIGILGLSRDIGERKQAEAVLREADRRKDEFIALLAHELRNPLAPLRNGLQVMRLAGADHNAVAQAQAMMDRQLSHMVRLIDDLLDVSRISRNKMELRRSRVLLADVVASAIETARPLLEAAGHRFTVSLPAEPIYLDADLTRLAQVFANLLTNSAKYTEHGGQVWLSAERHDSRVAVAVRDTGIGIPAEALPDIFDMFSQVDRSMERTAGGLGIGLALVRGLVEMHGGSVTAESAGQGQGSTFTVTLPTFAPVPEPRALGPSDNGLTTSTAKRRILVVDDNRDSAQSMAMMLELLGHEVRTAHDGIEAIDTAERYRPELILMDVGMPRLNGLDATRRIRATPWGNAVTIVALTGWGQDADRARSRQAGCDAHLVKPVHFSDLETVLHPRTTPRPTPTSSP